MNTQCKFFVDYIISEEAPKHNKQKVEDIIAEKFSLIKDRKVFHNDYFAVRFCYSKNSSESFSNTVLSLSALEKYDMIPFFVVLVRQKASNIILLANTTFLNKISHSSQELSTTNIKGSFNGSDIIRKYGDLANIPENFDDLFCIHQGFDWSDNLERLVDATSKIKPTISIFNLTSSEECNIYDSIDRAKNFILSPNFSILEKDLNDRCSKSKDQILIASHIENTNIRGRLIEILITSDDKERAQLINNLKDLESALPSYNTKNGLGDYCVNFNNGKTYTDIKTKIVYLHSNPKAYNIDKFLKHMSDTKSIFFFYIIGIDKNSIFKTILCSVYHSKLIDNTILQFHWAGRSTRGAAQFKGTAIDEMLQESDFRNVIDKNKCKKFLEGLLER